MAQMRRRAGLRWLGVGGLTLVAVACSGDDGTSSSSSEAGAGGGVQGLGGSNGPAGGGAGAPSGGRTASGGSSEGGEAGNAAPASGGAAGSGASALGGAAGSAAPGQGGAVGDAGAAGAGTPPSGGEAGSGGTAGGGGSAGATAGSGGSLVGGSAGLGGGGEGGAATLALTNSVTDHGITWTFDAEYPVGQFVTGDYYVLCPVTVESITPAPGGGRNGSVLNIPPSQTETGFDDRTEGDRYTASLSASLPISMVPGDSLASSISMAEPGTVENWLREGDGEYSSSPVASVSVLTCLEQAPPADAFRPSYADTTNRIYRLSDVNRALLPQLAPPSAVATDTLEMYADRLIRPWVDNLFYAFDAQVDTMAMYGREMGRVAGIASLLLMLDLPPEQQDVQERLLVGTVQHGIDLWGLVRAGYEGWYAHGGHGSGRKWPIIFAGLLFGDTEMSEPSITYPEVRFGEDMHTAFTSDLPYGPAYNGATVVYTGHMGVWQGEPVSDDPAWGPYEHLSPDQWLDPIGENYRRCCTSIAWVGQALAARLMNAQSNWDHDAFFAYVDRWMDPTGDDAYTQEIYDLTGLDYRAAWQRQGQAWDDFVNEMWATYR